MHTPRLAALFSVAVVLGVSGCEYMFPPSDRLYDLPNATRDWRRPSAAALVPSLAPVLRIKQTEFNLGEVSASEISRKKVLIRNAGSANLTIRKRSEDTSTIDLLERQAIAIPPMGEATVTLLWKPPRVLGEARSQIKLITNDPHSRVVELTVRGTPKTFVAIDPPVLTADRIRPDSTANTAVVVSSQIWPDFDIADAECDLSGVAWRFERAPVDLLQRVGAKSGYTVHATLPEDLPSGPIDGHQLTLKLVAGDANRYVAIPIRGNVLRRLAVYGEGISSDGVIDFGVVSGGRQHHREFALKVRDPETELKVNSIETEPSFLDVQLFASESAPGAASTYRMQVTLPAIARSGVLRGSNQGAIRINFDHPRIKKLELKVNAIVHRDAPRSVKRLTRNAPAAHIAASHQSSVASSAAMLQD